MKVKLVDPEVVRDIFSIIKQSNTEKECKDLPEIFDNELTVNALNSVHPEKPVNILHNLAVSEHCNIILPHLIKYIEPVLYQQRNHKGDTPIKAAISAGKLDNAKVLVEAQKSTLKDKGLTKKQIDEEIANTVNVRDKEGKTPLHIAADFHNPESVKFLIVHRADKTILDNDGYNPLQYAVSDISSDERKIATIIALGASSEELNTRDKDGNTALEKLRASQRPTWGKHQEKELMRACDRQNHKSSCVIM